MLLAFQETRTPPQGSKTADLYILTGFSTGSSEGSPRRIREDISS